MGENRLVLGRLSPPSPKLKHGKNVKNVNAKKNKPPPPNYNQFGTMQLIFSILKLQEFIIQSLVYSSAL